MKKRPQEAAITAKNLTPDEVAKVKALKKTLGFKNNSQLVNYLLDKHASSNHPRDIGQI